MKIAISLISILSAICGLLAEESLDVGSAGLSQLEMLSKLDGFKPGDNEFRIYFIGDSITRHGFNKDTIERMKWDHVAGMSASSEDKDYAHLLAARISQAIPGRKTVIFFGRGGDARNALSGMEAAMKFQPDLLVVQLGEHVPPQEPKEKVAADYAALLDALKALPASPMIICTGVWNSQQKRLKGYIGHTAQVEEAQAETCARKGVAFVSVERYALDPACSGSGENEGVKWHPNDEGQLGYAKEIFAAFEKLRNASGADRK